MILSNILSIISAIINKQIYKHPEYNIIMLRKRGLNSMNRKALSDIVTTVLIILLVLAAVIILWAFVRVFVLNGGGRIETGVFTSSFSIPAKDVNIVPVEGSPQDASFKVVRNAGEGRLKALTVVIEDVNKKRFSKRVESNLRELESQIIVVDSSEITSNSLGRIKKISIAPIVLNKDGKEIQAGIAATYVVQGTEGTTIGAPSHSVGESCNAGETSGCLICSSGQFALGSCSAGLVCGNNGACIPTGSIGYICTLPSQCNSGLICLNGVCSCNDENDCSGSTPHCEISRGSCVECRDATDCSTGELCTNNVCTPDESCTLNNECNPGFSCVDSVCTPISYGDPWTQYMYNSAHTGKANSVGPSTLSNPKIINLESVWIRSNIVAGKDIIYFITGTGAADGNSSKLYAYDVSGSTPEYKWNYTLDAKLSTTPLLDLTNDAIYVNGAEKIYKIKASTGELVWETTVTPYSGTVASSPSGSVLYRSEYPRQSPVMDGSGKIYFPKNNRIFRYNPDGTLDEAIDVGTNTYIRATPLVTDNKIIFLDATSTKFKYTVSLTDFTISSTSDYTGYGPQGYKVSPILVGNKVYVGSASYGELKSYDKNSMAFVSQTGYDGATIHTPASDGTRIFSNAGEGSKIFSYDLSLSDRKESDATLDSITYSGTYGPQFDLDSQGATIISSNNIVYVNSGHTVYAFNSQTLGLIQKSDIGYLIDAPSTLYEGKLYVPTNAGKIYIFG